jgi:hypothetical protein
VNNVATGFHPVLVKPIPSGGRLVTCRECHLIRKLGYACAYDRIVERYEDQEDIGVIYPRTQGNKGKGHVANSIYLRSLVKLKNKLEPLHEEVIERYKAGESTFDLARAFKVSNPTIRSLMDQHGVKRRSFPEAGRFTMNPDRRKNLSQKMTGKVGSTRGRIMPHRQGKNAPGWKGGISPLMRTIRNVTSYRRWRKAVLANDKRCCRTCGTSEGWIDTHHIIHFSDIISAYEVKTLEDALNVPLLWDVNNGVTLCHFCHRLAHFMDKQPVIKARVYIEAGNTMEE